MSSKDRKKAKKKSERQRKVQHKKQQAEVKLKQHRMGYQPVNHDYHLNPDDDEQLQRDLADILVEIEPQEFKSELLFSLVEYVEQRQQLSDEEKDDLYDFASACDEPAELMDRLGGWNDPWMQAQYHAFEVISAEDEEEARRLREKAIQADPTNLQANHLVLQKEPASLELIEKIDGLLKLELERFGPKLYETDSVGSACALAGSSLQLMMLLSKTQYELGQNDEAIRSLRRCIELDSSKAYLRRLRLISMLLELGRLDEASEEIDKHEDLFGPGLILPYASALECYLSGDMAEANEFLEIGMEDNLPFIVELIEQEELKAKPVYQGNPLSTAGMIGVELLGNAWRTYPGSGDWLSERMAIKMRTGISRPSAKECGLCGKTSKLTKTPCCGRWICDDNDQYVMMSFARNSCYRNHARYTLCGTHHHAGHEGTWQDCEECKGMGGEMYAYSGMNHYNFEFLKKVPLFERKRCSQCDRLMDLTREGYTHKPEGIVCCDCEPQPEFGKETKAPSEPGFMHQVTGHSLPAEQ